MKMNIIRLVLALLLFNWCMIVTFSLFTLVKSPQWYTYAFCLLNAVGSIFWGVEVFNEARKLKRILCP